MNNTIRLIMQGVTFAIVIVGLALLTFAIFNNSTESVEKFKVVEKYKNCSVVRYTDPTNRWHYLLHCGL